MIKSLLFFLEKKRNEKDRGRDYRLFLGRLRRGPREMGWLGRAYRAGRPKKAQDARARREERERVRWTGLTTRGPGWDPLVSGSAHRERGACHAQKFPNRIPSRMCIKIPVQDQPGYTNDNVDIQIHVLQT